MAGEKGTDELLQWRRMSRAINLVHEATAG